MNRIVLLILIAPVLCVLNSCNVIGPAVQLFHPEEMTEAVYKLKDRPTVVFIDDRRNLVTPTSLRRVIADRISQDLMVKKVLSMSINSTDAEAVARQRDTDLYAMPIGEIGRAVGAEQVIYIEMLEFNDRPNQYDPKPRGRCQVRVIDVVEETRLFPAPSTENSGHPLEVVMNRTNADQFSSRARRNQVAQALAEQIGFKTAQLFYRYNSEKLGKNLNGG